MPVNFPHITQVSNGLITNVYNQLKISPDHQGELRLRVYNKEDPKTVKVTKEEPGWGRTGSNLINKASWGFVNTGEGSLSATVTALNTANTTLEEQVALLVDGRDFSDVDLAQALELAETLRTALSSAAVGITHIVSGYAKRKEVDEAQDPQVTKLRAQALKIESMKQRIEGFIGQRSNLRDSLPNTDIDKQAIEDNTPIESPQSPSPKIPEEIAELKDHAAKIALKPENTLLDEVKTLTGWDSRCFSRDLLDWASVVDENLLTSFQYDEQGVEAFILSIADHTAYRAQITRDELLKGVTTPLTMKKLMTALIGIESYTNAKRQGKATNVINLSPNKVLAPVEIAKRVKENYLGQMFATLESWSSTNWVAKGICVDFLSKSHLTLDPYLKTLYFELDGSPASQ